MRLCLWLCDFLVLWFEDGQFDGTQNGPSLGEDFKVGVRAALGKSWPDLIDP